MKIPILRLRDKDGKEIVIPAIRGPRGPAGDGTGDMVASVYDPTGKETDIFEYVDSAISGHDHGLKTETWTFALEDGSIVTKAVYVE